MVSPKYFFQANGNAVRQRKVYKMKEVRHNLTIKGCHVFHVRSHKDLELLIMVTPILLLIKVIL